MLSVLYNLASLILGGSTANMYAINMARYKLNEDYKMCGNFSSKPLTIFASDQVNFTVEQKWIV